MVYIMDSKWINDPTRITGKDGGYHMEYAVDDASETSKLPKMDMIMGLSTCLVIPTKQVKVLTETGWDKEL